MTSAIPTVLFRHDALAGYHGNHLASHVGTDITILWKNKSTCRKRTTTIRGPDSWRSIPPLHLAANLFDDPILVCARVLQDNLATVSDDELHAHERRSTSMQESLLPRSFSSLVSPKSLRRFGSTNNFWL